MMLQSTYNFQRASIRGSVDPTTQQTPGGFQPLKIQYLNTNFQRKLHSETHLKDCLSHLRDFFKYDSVLVPFFYNAKDDKRANLVLINMATSSADLIIVTHDRS
ncbi:hypothetical protein FGO68_gene5884 [Halteria grandinella]|uniref:Uncharacterized protein n=1 Tax=Halteria grandinella TaxID=5974 RepID=A0A8J8NV73_HALGN|nr:hypothetical protein FGO68_gene5884 [Halteria grandinella]